jgi:putative intracellular protease/amidase
VAEVDGTAYDAIFVAGGHGAVADLGTDPAVGALLAAADGAGRVVSAVCHGVVALLNGDAAASRLVRGRRLTGFSDAEEDAVGKTAAVGGPGQTLEARLKAAGATYTAGPDWAPHVVIDGRLVTGQNPQSSAGVAAAVVEAVEKPPTPAVDAGGA